MTFRELLKNKKITQQKLADQIGKSQRLVSNWCLGDSEPQIKELISLKNLLQIDYETLLKGFEKNKIHLDFIQECTVDELIKEG